MQEYIIATAIGCAVFLLFMLVFLRKDIHGKRGGRLANCGHHGTDHQCDRCRDTAPATILPHPPGKDRTSADGT